MKKELILKGNSKGSKLKGDIYSFHKQNEKDD